jgi:glycosyltransferase involved in cell wall biosynthesis
VIVLHSNNILISVIVAVLNGERTLQRCIDSISIQTHPNKELIIIDGGSGDKTVDILSANNDKINYWESKPDRGICHAWNKALNHAKGSWVCFLGADDYFLENNILERMARRLSETPPDIKIVYGRVAYVTEKCEVLQVVGEPWNKIKRLFLQQNVIPHQGIMHHRALFELHGKFDDAFRIAGDYELLLRELKTADALYIDDLILTGMQIGGLSNEMNLKLLALQEMARARIKNKVKVLPFIWAWSYTKAWIRVKLIQFIGEKSISQLTDLYRKLTGRPSYWTK